MIKKLLLAAFSISAVNAYADEKVILGSPDHSIQLTINHSTEAHFNMALH